MDLKTVFFITIVLASSLAEYKSYKDYKVYKIVPVTEKDVQIILDLQKNVDYMFWTDVIQEKSDVRIMVAPEKQSEFQSYLSSVGIKTNIVIEDVQKQIDAQLEKPKLNRINNDYAWDYYQPIEEIYEWIDKIVEEHADVATSVTIGTTVEGRPIRGVKIDYKKQENPTIGMLEGGIHAREWISPATMTWVINEFLTSTDPNIRFMAENVVWHIFPVVNPDGYAYTFTNNRMWRKNRNPANAVTCAQWNLADDMGNGIDLNRNFGFLWMSVGASSNPCAETYAGPVANSEQETTAIINYVNGLKQQGNLVYYIAFHSFSQMVLVPFSHAYGVGVLEVANYGDLFEIAIRGMDKLRQRNGTEYTVGTSAEILYSVSGSSFDWAKGEADIPISYLFELRDTGEFGFLLPRELIVDNNREIMDGLVEMDRVARQMGYYSANGHGNSVKYSASIIMLALAMLAW